MARDTDPVTPMESGLTIQGLKDEANKVGDRFMRAGEAYMRAIRAFEVCSIDWLGAIGSLYDAGASTDEIIGLASGVARRAGATTAQVAQMELEVRAAIERFSEPTTAEKVSLL